MKPQRRLLLGILFGFFWLQLAPGSGITVPIDDPVYVFLKRMETRGVVSNLYDGTLPFHRSEIATLLQQIKAQRQQLTILERSLLDEHIADYRWELTSQSHPDLPAAENFSAPFYDKGYLKKRLKNPFAYQAQTEERHLFIYEDQDRFIWGDARIRIQPELRNGHTRQRVADLYRLRSQLSPHLSAAVSFYWTLFTKNDGFPELKRSDIGASFVDEPGFYYYDQYHSSLVYHRKNVSLGFYRQPTLWGPSQANNLILSDNASAFSYIKFKGQLKKVVFNFLHGSLLNDSSLVRSAPLSLRNRSKYFVAHRFELPLFDESTHVAWSEMIVYGDRNMELDYLMPFNFFFSVEHARGDRDNLLMAFDFESQLFNNFTLYGTWFWDELNWFDLFSAWWANKHALQIGGRWATTLGDRLLDCQLEYTALRPWTYTHKFLTTNYTHGAQSLGFPYGPNTQHWYLKSNLYLTTRQQLRLESRYWRHGHDSATRFWGGDITSRYTQRDPAYDQKTHWLMGNIRTHWQIDLAYTYEWTNDAFILARISYRSSTAPVEDCLFLSLGMTLDL